MHFLILHLTLTKNRYNDIHLNKYVMGHPFWHKFVTYSSCNTFNIKYYSNLNILKNLHIRINIFHKITVCTHVYKFRLAETKYTHCIQNLPYLKHKYLNTASDNKNTHSFTLYLASRTKFSLLNAVSLKNI